MQLDAGPVININGPKGPKQLTKENGVYRRNWAAALPQHPDIPGIPGGAAAPDYLEPGPIRSITAPVAAARMPSALSM